MSLETLLAEWCWPGPRRSVGTPHQVHHSHRDAVDQLAALITKEKAPVYVSANPYNEDGGICAIDRLFFDVDNEKRVRDAYRDAVRLNHHLAEYYRAGDLTAFSGSKGYHVYVFLQQPVEGPEAELKPLYGDLQRMITAGVKYRTLDPQVIGDVKRLCRVSYSRHQKTGELCVPVTIGHVPEPYKLQQGFTATLRSHGLSPALVDLARRNLSKPKTRPRRPYTGPSKIRPRIEAVLEARSVRGPHHVMKLAAVAEMLTGGYAETQIVERFSKTDGFDERKTRYYVRHAARRGYRPFRCETITKNGGCLGPRCPIYKGPPTPSQEQGVAAR